MPQVAVQINGKTYRMACDEGQEAHLLDLAKRFDKSISQLKGSFGEIGDQRLTVMAGVMVTDEMVALQTRLAALESEVANLRARGSGGGGGASDSRVAEALTGTAKRIDAISAKLESAER